MKKRGKKPVASKKRPAARRAVAKKAKTAPKKKAAKKVSFIASGYTSITPFLVVRSGHEAMKFYARAFGAKTISTMPMPDGGLAHGEMQIGNARFMLGDEMPAMGSSAPPTVGGSAVHIFVYVKNVDATYAQAVAAGATGTLPPTDMFWGDRYSKLTDPFGHHWNLATHIEDVGPKEMMKRAAAAMAEGGPGAG